MTEQTQNAAAACGQSDSTELLGFSVGQEVTVTRKIWEQASEDGPGGLLAQPGEKLIVRKLRAGGLFPICVSHHDRTDGNTFAVTPDEICAYVRPNSQLTGPEQAQLAKGPR